MPFFLFTPLQTPCFGGRKLKQQYTPTSLTLEYTPLILLASGWTTVKHLVEGREFNAILEDDLDAKNLKCKNEWP